MAPVSPAKTRPATCIAATARTAAAPTKISGLAQLGTLVGRVIVDLGQPPDLAQAPVRAFALELVHLQDDVDLGTQQPLDVAALEALPFVGFLDPQHQHLERTCSAAGVDRRDRARVTRADVDDVVVGDL